MDSNPLHNPIPSDRLSFGELAALVPEMRAFFDRLIEAVGAAGGLTVDRSGPDDGSLNLRWVNGRPMLGWSGLGVQQFVVIDQDVDKLTCLPYYPPLAPVDGRGAALVHNYDASFGQDYPTQQRVYVAKPFFLQQTPWDGQMVLYQSASVSFTFNYTGQGQRNATPSDGSPVQKQILYPDYFKGDLILAVLARSGLRDPNQHLVELMDLNCAGRQWITLC